VKRSTTHSSILALPARDEEIPNAMEFIEKIMEAAGFSSRKVMEVQLAVAEALMNIVSTTPTMAGDGMIDIISGAHEDGLMVTLKDEGSKFDHRPRSRGLIFLAM